MLAGYFSAQLLTLVGGGNVEGFTVLSDGAACYLNALLKQQVGNLVIRKRLGGIFLADQLFDHGAYCCAGGFAAPGSPNVAGEKELQFEYTARGMHEFLRGYA